MNIHLCFVNRSKEMNNLKVVLFQKNVASSIGELAVAWKVIENCAPGCFHPICYSTQLALSVSDFYGNHTPIRPVDAGQVYSVSPTPLGRRVHSWGRHEVSGEVAVRNDLERGAINVNIYSNKRRLATKTAVAPQQKALFEFTPTLWIGAVSEVEQGQVLSSAVLSEVNTELPLVGVVSADIVMTGGGSGPDAGPLMFSLENVVGVNEAH